MSDNIDVTVGVLKNEVQTLKDEMREVKGTVSPIRDRQIEHGNQLKQLLDSVNELTSSTKKTNDKVDSILDDFHDSLLKAAEARQFWVWMRTNGPPFVTLLVGVSTIGALMRLALMHFLGIK